MGKQYKAELRAEAVKLSEELGPKAVEEIVASTGSDGLVYENEALKTTLKEREEEIEILQDALGFFAKRRKK